LVFLWRSRQSWNWSSGWSAKAGLERWISMTQTWVSEFINKWRKNETSTHVPAYGYSHASCL
jgi:hypothetical protein